MSQNQAYWNKYGNMNKTLLASSRFEELYVILAVFAREGFRALEEKYIQQVNDSYTFVKSTRVVAFISFMVALSVAYLILWIPFVNRLSKEIWKTKSLLTIIPIEVILKIQSI